MEELDLDVNKILKCAFFTFVPCIVILSKILFTNECRSDCLKNNTKIYIKIAPTCFDAVTPSSGSALFVLAKVTVF